MEVTMGLLFFECLEGRLNMRKMSIRGIGGPGFPSTFPDASSPASGHACLQVASS